MIASPGKIIDGSTTADDGSYDVVIKLDGPIPTLAELPEIDRLWDVAKKEIAAGETIPLDQFLAKELPEPPASTVLEGTAIASHRASLAEAIKNGDKLLAAYYACLLALIAIDPSVEGSGGSISGDGYFIKIEEVAGAK